MRSQTAMEEGWLRSCWGANWRIAPAVAAMRQGERRPEMLLLNEDPRSDGLTDVILGEIRRREAEAAPASTELVAESPTPTPTPPAKPTMPSMAPAARQEWIDEEEAAMGGTSPLDPEEEMMQATYRGGYTDGSSTMLRERHHGRSCS